MEVLISFVVPFIILLTVVVFVHEYGHYYYAKKYGVGVTDFSIGFGKEIFGYKDKSLHLVIEMFSQAEQEELQKNIEADKKL